MTNSYYLNLMILKNIEKQSSNSIFFLSSPVKGMICNNIFILNEQKIHKRFFIKKYAYIYTNV